MNYIIGMDYGTDSVRALLVDTQNSKELAEAVFVYPRWKQGLYCDKSKNQFRQHPLDYLEGLEFVVNEVLKQIPDSAKSVKAISIDTTGSTPSPVNEQGIPLALLDEFADNPNAMNILWKDHTAIHEADEINDKSKSWGGVDYTKYSGGKYSSEWFWAKALHIIRKDERVEKAAFTWMEHSDWLPAMLVGNKEPHKFKRNRCAAGHKAMWNEEWGGFPSEEFLSTLDVRLAKIRRNMNDETITSDKAVGNLTEEWAKKLGLPTTVLIGSGALDAHIGAVGGEIKPYHISKVMGTSTCDMLTAPLDKLDGNQIRGIAGQVDGSIVPGMLGMEAGQSAFGDVYAWFKELLMWPIENILPKIDGIDKLAKDKIKYEIGSQLIEKLTEEAAKIPISESGVLALDWLNGRRTPDVNATLTGALTGLSLGTEAPQLFRALVEATAFGSRAIMERFITEGVPVEGVLALGGVAKKSPFVMQTMSDVLNKPIEVVASEQTCALGSAMYAAVVAGIYPDIHTAQEKLGQGFEKTYYPIESNVKIYDVLYEKYLQLGSIIVTL